MKFYAKKENKIIEVSDNTVVDYYITPNPEELCDCIIISFKDGNLPCCWELNEDTTVEDVIKLFKPQYINKVYLAINVEGINKLVVEKVKEKWKVL